MLPSYYAYFRGGDIAGIGATQAGWLNSGGVEYDPDIAQVADSNTPYVRTRIANVHTVDPATLVTEAPVWFHVSPSCLRAASAGTGIECIDDIHNAEAVTRFIAQWQPQYVTIENVWRYRTFRAFKHICQTLVQYGYAGHYDRINAADYGTPQSRSRLILIANRGSMRIPFPKPTHTHQPNGWYDAIADLIPALDLTTLPQYILRHIRLPLDRHFMPSAVNADGTTIPRFGNQPAFTLQATAYKATPRIYIHDPLSDMQSVGTYHNGTHCFAQGKVYKLNPRAFARLQGIPDSYILPGDHQLSYRVIGNGVAVEVFYAIALQLYAHYKDQQ